MKIKAIVLALLLIWCLMWGRDYYVQAYNVIVDYKSTKTSVDKLKKESANARKDVQALYSQIDQLRVDNINMYDKVELTQSIENLEGVQINTITAKKLNSLGESVIIASVTNSADVSRFTNIVQCMEFEITSSDVSRTIKDIECMKLVCRNLKVFPTENQIVLEIQVGGVVK